MPNIRDRERDDYIFYERYKKGRTYKSIGDELGIGMERVRQIYTRACYDRTRKYRLRHPELQKEWMASPKDFTEEHLAAYMREFEGEE